MDSYHPSVQLSCFFSTCSTNSIVLMSPYIPTPLISSRIFAYHPSRTPPPQGGIEHMKSTQVFAAACSATQLGVRLNEEQLALLAAKAGRTLKYSTPEDVANLAAVLAPYNRWALQEVEGFGRRV